MNLLQIRTEALRYLDDDSESFWDATEINSYINAAYDYYYALAVDENYPGLLSAPAILNIVSGTETVALPSDFFKVKMLERVFTTKTVACQYIDRLDGANLLTSTDQSYYVPTWKIVGANIVLEPTPSASYVGGLKLNYWPVSVAMVADIDTPIAGFRSPWHRMLPIRAAIMAKGGREENDTSQLDRMIAPLEINFMNNLESITASRKFVEPFMTTDESI